MPQLNPTPWFIILLITWLAFIIISPMKISNFTSPNDFTKTTSVLCTKSWLWPWQ